MISSSILRRGALLRHTRCVRWSSSSSKLPSKGQQREHVHEKESHHTSEPTVSHSGSKTYVVSEPDPKDTHYDVPSGAYSSTSPYSPQKTTTAPEPTKHSSSSASPAHPTTTKAAPKNESGIGSSSDVRFRSSPGEMSGGKDGGLGLMDEGGTSNLEQKGMGERNPQPKGEEEGKLGVKDAWKHRR